MRCLREVVGVDHTRAAIVFVYAMNNKKGISAFQDRIFQHRKPYCEAPFSFCVGGFLAPYAGYFDV